MTENQKAFEAMVKLADSMRNVEGQPLWSPSDIEEMFLRASFRVGLGTMFRKNARRIEATKDEPARWEWEENGERWGAYEGTPCPRVLGTIKVSNE